MAARRAKTDPTTVYTSKNDLIHWASQLLQLHVSKLEQFSSGAVFCQLVDSFAPKSVAIQKINFFAREEHEALQNYKQLQAAFNKLDITKEISIAKLSKGAHSDNLELLQYLYKYFKKKQVPSDYNPVERRKLSIKGGTNSIPLPSFMGSSFNLYGKPDRSLSTSGAVAVPESIERTNSVLSRAGGPGPKSPRGNGPLTMPLSPRSASLLGSQLSRMPEAVDEEPATEPDAVQGTSRAPATSDDGGSVSTPTAFERPAKPLSPRLTPHVALTTTPGDLPWNNGQLSSPRAPLATPMAEPGSLVSTPRALSFTPSPKVPRLDLSKVQVVGRITDEDSMLEAAMAAVEAEKASRLSPTAGSATVFPRQDAATEEDQDADTAQEPEPMEEGGRTDATTSGGAKPSEAEEAAPATPPVAQRRAETVHDHSPLSAGADEEALVASARAASSVAVLRAMGAPVIAAAVPAPAAAPASGRLFFNDLYGPEEEARRRSSEDESFAQAAKAVAPFVRTYSNSLFEHSGPGAEAAAAPQPPAALGKWNSPPELTVADSASSVRLAQAVRASPPSPTGGIGSRRSSGDLHPELDAARSKGASPIHTRWSQHEEDSLPQQAGARSPRDVPLPMEPQRVLSPELRISAGSGGRVLAHDAGALPAGAQPRSPMGLTSRASLELMPLERLVSIAVELAGQAGHSVSLHLPTLVQLAAGIGAREDSLLLRSKLRNLQDALSTLSQHGGRLQQELADVTGSSGAEAAVARHAPAVARLAGTFKDADMELRTAAWQLHMMQSRAPLPDCLLPGPAVPEEAASAENGSLGAAGTRRLDALLHMLGAVQAALVRHRGQAAATSSAAVLASGSDSRQVGGQYVKRLRNGDLYRGCYAGKRKSGLGTYGFANGDMYEGEWSADRMHGHGVYAFAFEGRFEGQWAAGTYEGAGAETFAKGSTYSGEYSGATRHGCGICRFHNGDYYEGRWQRGLRHGPGMQHFSDGSGYVGEFWRGRRQGHGVYSFAGGDRYLGQHEDDVPHGVGVYVFAAGEVYEGSWVRGRKNGWSVYSVQSGEQWAGLWEAGKLQWAAPLLGHQQAEAISLQLAQQAAAQAREAAQQAAERAEEHWLVDGPVQRSVRSAVEQAAHAATLAQQAQQRARAAAAELLAAAATEPR